MNKIKMQNDRMYNTCSAKWMICHARRHCKPRSVNIDT